MAKAQTKNSKGQRFWGWFSHHKVIAVFASLLTLTILLIFASIVMHKVRVYVEKQRYSSAAVEMNTIKSKLSILQPTKALYIRGCQHSSSGGVFTADRIYCSIGIESTYLNANQTERDFILQKTKDVLETEDIKLSPDQTNQSREGIASYAFRYRRLMCFFDAWYFDQSTPGYDRDPTMPTQGTETETKIYCGGNAIADYLPVMGN